MRSPKKVKVDGLPDKKQITGSFSNENRYLTDWCNCEPMAGI
jgi:hypothetical protein